jgi:predicted TPR repeat methyltransferase
MDHGIDHWRSEAEALEKRLALDPARAEAWDSLGLCRLNLGQYDLAAAAYRRSIDADPSRLAPYRKLTGILAARGELAAAQELILAALERHPGDAALVHRLAAVRGQSPPRPPAGHVAEVFDAMAHDFDRHLVEELGYRVPEMIAQRLRPFIAYARPARIIDLGCGTGLVGAALAAAGATAEVTGIDLSRRMLEQARARGGYARLVQGDIVEELRRMPAGEAHAIVAADVFVYLGELDGVYEAAARALAPAGVFMFSVEGLDAGDYQLHPNGRYAHSAGYLRRLAAKQGLPERAMEAVPIRRDGAGHLRGWLASFSA